MTPKPKTPTASGISRLLSSAGHIRAVRQMRGGRSGFVVTADHLHRSRVRVRHQFWSMGMQSPERHREWRDRYAATIEAAGWSVEPTEFELIVTAKPEDSPSLAAKEGD